MTDAEDSRDSRHWDYVKKKWEIIFSLARNGILTILLLALLGYAVWDLADRKIIQHKNKVSVTETNKDYLGKDYLGTFGLAPTPTAVTVLLENEKPVNPWLTFLGYEVKGWRDMVFSPPLILGILGWFFRHLLKGFLVKHLSSWFNQEPAETKKDVESLEEEIKEVLEKKPEEKK